MKLQIIPLSLAFVLVALLGACKKAEQTQPGDKSNTGVLLKAKWPVGNRYVYRMGMDQQTTNRVPNQQKPVQQDTVMSMTYALSVVKETADGGRELGLEFLANQLEVKMGGRVVVSFDSKEADNDQEQNPLMAAFHKMIGSKVRLLVNADGKISDVAGLEEWRNSLALEDAGPAGQMMAGQFNSAFFRQLADFGRGLSAKPVTVGETWPFKVEIPTGSTGKIAVDAKITLKGYESHAQHQCAILESQGTLKGTPGDEVTPMGRLVIDTGKVHGRSWFDPELGALIDSVSDQTIRVKGIMPAQANGGRGTGGFSSDIGQKITVTLVRMGKSSG